MSKILIRDDFSDLPVGPLTIDNTATGEYHFQPFQADVSRWYPAVNRAEWLVLEKEGRHRLLAAHTSGKAPRRTAAPTLVAGSPDWRDYTAAIQVQPLKPGGFAGLAFRYESSRVHYRFVLENGQEAKLVYAEHGTEEVLAKAKFSYSCDRTYALRVRVTGGVMKACIDGRHVLEAKDARLARGRVALIAHVPAFFDRVEVTTTKAAQAAFVRTRRKAERHLDALRERGPKPALWRRIGLHDFGAGRQIRWGDLTGDGRLDFVMAQGIRPSRDAYPITCLTAVSLAGDVLWQVGEPRRNSDVLTADLPFQIYDIDGDGANEVLCAWEFEFVVLDGRTGAVKARMPMPVAPNGQASFGRNEAYFDRVMCDSIIVANFRGLDRPSDFVIKDRYHHVWAYDNAFNPLWTVPCRTGHFAQPYDFDGDGRDELIVGYTLIGPDGEVRWSKDWGDHTDEIVIGRFDPARRDVQIGWVCGDEGFNILSPKGRALHRDHLGHAQRVSAAKFRRDLPGLQFYVVTYWGNPGIISLHDCTGSRLFAFEPTATGSILNPVNWTGEGTELALMSASVRHGGMLDGHGRRVVLFPDDGHPELACESIDLTGDARDEIAVWDREQLWIYTQDRPFEGKAVYRPRRFPHYNASNYRGETSLPV
ncbi:MAG: hypothetical protein JXR37_06165 [Kiritimatiellae bacterium]|nr:hypothetical protein [Kiritimatiellia bacterium]